MPRTIVVLTMIHDSASHRVLKVGELARLVAGELILTSQKGAVNLACACRYLSEPVLSTLWETWERLNNLMETLSQEIWLYHTLPSRERVVRGLIPDGEMERLSSGLS